MGVFSSSIDRSGAGNRTKWLTLTTFVLLFLLTGSLILPLKALLMNVLMLSAAFGLLVLIFQDGRPEGLLGLESEGALEATQPVLLFAPVFGLSTATRCSC